MEKFKKQLTEFIKARFPYIYIETHEEERVTKTIREIATNVSVMKMPREVFTWSQASGLKKGDSVVPNSKTPNQLFDIIKKYDKNSVFIIYDFHVFFGCKGRNADNEVIRALRDLIPSIKLSQVRKNIISDIDKILEKYGI